MKNDIVIPAHDLMKSDININEYLILFNIANNFVISNMLSYDIHDIVDLENKGFIKVVDNTIHLRSKAMKFFSDEEDLFETWLKTYPVSVKKSNGGKRALSPASPDTMLGKRLKAKWKTVFRKDVEKQKTAIAVLEAQLKDMKKSGDLEYMVEATRWLNEGYHEKYAYLLEEDVDQQYENEDYL